MNIIHFNAQHPKKLVFCFIDTLWKISDNWIKEIIKNQSDYTITNLFNKNYSVFQGCDENELLKTASKEFDYACVFSTGTEFINGDSCFDHFEQLIKKDFFIIGHILDRGDAYFELHQQCYLIDLRKYKLLGFPRVGDQSLGEAHLSIEPLRSDENIHHDYTPLWIRQGDTQRTYKHKAHGWNIIKHGLEKYEILAFDNEIRKHKIHLYPESDKDFYDKISYVYKKQSYCESEFIHKKNTEYSNPKLKNLRQIITPASGWQWKEYLNESLPCNVIFFDYNQSSLDYWKAQVKNIENIDFKFLKWNLLVEVIDLSAHLDLTLENQTLFNFSNIFCYEGTSSLVNTKYRLRRENEVLAYVQRIMPNCFVNFTSRANTGFIPDVQLIDRAKDLPVFSIQDFKKPTWHIYDWN